MKPLVVAFGLLAALPAQAQQADPAALGLDIAITGLSNSAKIFGEHYRQLTKELEDAKREIAARDAYWKAWCGEKEGCKQ